MCTIDPYAVVSFDSRSQKSIVVNESVCPTWDQTLIFKHIHLFGDLDMIETYPPPIIIELFDKDLVRHAATGV